jgi:hypothetical protein
MRSRFVFLLSAASILMAAAPGLAQGFERFEPAFGEAVPSPEHDLTDKAVFLLQYDDGAANQHIFTSGSHYAVAMRFDGLSGDDLTINSVEMCWRSTSSDDHISYEVVIWDNDGSGGSPGTELAAFLGEADGVDNSSQFFTTSINFPIDDPSVYVGVRWNPVVEDSIAYCLDFDGFDGEVQPGYRMLTEEADWVPLTAIQPSYHALMLRVLGSTPPPQPDIQIVPLFEVDTTSGAGTTTLFAVRNLTGSNNGVDITYYTVDGVEQRVDSVILGPRETHTVNVRDVAGLDTDPDGVKRGYIEIFGIARTDGTPTFGSDFFQVDVGNDFGTGQRTRRIVEACEVESLRFLEFPLPGSGTEVTVWLQFPQGTGAGDPFSFRVRRYDEAGNFLGTTSFKTDDHVIKLDASDLTGVPFGTFEIDFENASRGFAYAESSVQGRFSVGVDSQCELP